MIQSGPRNRALLFLISIGPFLSSLRTPVRRTAQRAPLCERMLSPRVLLENRNMPFITDPLQNRNRRLMEASIGDGPTPQFPRRPLLGDSVNRGIPSLAGASYLARNTSNSEFHYTRISVSLDSYQPAGESGGRRRKHGAQRWK